MFLDIITGFLAFLLFFICVALAVWESIHLHKQRLKQMELLDTQLSILLAYAEKNDINI